MLNRFPWSKPMTTRIPGQYPVQQTRGATSLVEPQSKDDALLRTWFPKLRGSAVECFSAEWRKAGLPLSGNYEAAKKLYDQLFRGGKTRSKTSIRPRSLSATMPSGAAHKPKPLTERAVHVPSPSAQAPAPASEPCPEIYIDLSDFLASTATEAKTEEAPAPLEAKSSMRLEDEVLCKELDKSLEDWTRRFNKPAGRGSRRHPTTGFREEFMEHCEHLRQIYRICVAGVEDQRALLLEHVSAHVSDLLSVAGQSENFYDLVIVATSAKALLSCYPDAEPRVDLGARLAETFRQRAAQPDGSSRGMFKGDLIDILTNVITATHDSAAQALMATAFQYCEPLVVHGLHKRLREADWTRYQTRKWEEYFRNSLEQTAQTIRNLSMRGSDQHAAELFMRAVRNDPQYWPCGTTGSGLLKTYQALSGRAKYLALQKWLQDRDLKNHFLNSLPSTEEADAVRKEIEEFPSSLPLPEVSTGGDVLSIIKKLEEAFANLPGPLADNVAALLHSHIQAFLESASTSSESWDERAARHEVLLGALNYAFTIHRALTNLVDALSADEARTVKSWFDKDDEDDRLFGRIHGNAISETVDARLKALGARDCDW
jgi:hypothetical protein